MKVRYFALLVSFLLGHALAPSSHAASFAVLHHFSGPDGANPAGRPSMDSYGNLYGTTSGGGNYNLGTLFRLNVTRFQTLHHFNGTNGASPWGSLLADADGNLYGTTISGGTSGWGTVFNYDRELGQRVIKSFAGGTEGGQPFGGVARDAEGNLYGTTFFGGNMSCGSIGCGTIFKIDPVGVFQQFHVFADADGPNAIRRQEQQGHRFCGDPIT